VPQIRHSPTSGGSAGAGCETLIPVIKAMAAIQANFLIGLSSKVV
jgi:hypothetical protein